MKHLLLLLGLLLAPLPAAAELRFFGDLLLSRGVENYLATEGEGTLRSALAPFWQDDAIRLVNLEGALGEESACAERPQPCFTVKAERLPLLDPFDVVSLQNNHALDGGPLGLRRTLHALQQRQVRPLGDQDFTALLPTPQGNFGVVAITDVINAPSDRKHVVAADSPEVLAAIRRLRREAALVAVYVHWGRELLPVATQRNRELARSFLAAGADLVVGTHPHVTGPVECLDGKPVIHSLGNFLFDQKFAATKRGAVLACNIETGELRCRLEGHQTAENSYLPVPLVGEYAEGNAILAACTPSVTPSWSGIFTADRRKKRLEIHRDLQRPKLATLRLYDLDSNRLETETPAMPVVRVQLVDLNRDGIQEVFLLQQIYSGLDREVAKRVYLYSFDGPFHALWRGSALSRPLHDAVFVEQSGADPLLVALHSSDAFIRREKNSRGRVVMGYRWNGFGFTGLGSTRLSTPADAIDYRKKRLRLTNGKALLAELDPAPLRKLGY